MAKSDKSVFVTVLFFVIFGLIHATCKNVDPATGEKIFYSEHVIVGTVQDIIKPDPKFGDSEQKAYGAKFQVKCIYKGGAIPEDITIVGAGEVGDQCHSTNLTKGGVFIMFVKKLDEQEKWFQPQYKENDGGEQMIDEITFNCYMDPIPPIGKENMQTDCPVSEDYPGETCDVWTPPTTPKPEPTPEPESTPEPDNPKTTTKTGSQGGGTGAGNTQLGSCTSILFCIICSLLLLL